MEKNVGNIVVFAALGAMVEAVGFLGEDVFGLGSSRAKFGNVCGWSVCTHLEGCQNTKP